MLRPVPAVLLALLLSGTAGRAYTCNSLIGNLDCGRGSSRQVGAATGRTEGHSREAESELPRHHRREYPWCSVGSAGYHGHCGFSSHEQCLQTVRGVGGLCSRNPAYRR